MNKCCLHKIRTTSVTISCVCSQILQVPIHREWCMILNNKTKQVTKEAQLGNIVGEGVKIL